MRLLIFAIPLLFIISGAKWPTLTKASMSYTRVKDAYAGKEKIIVKNLTEHAISRDSLRIYLRAFKTEKKIEVWAKNTSDSAFVLVKELPICELAGYLGPKRRSHDMQVPEGFYYISDLNPYSKYYLSMKINYPNASDSIRGVRGHWGNEIYIHGDCISSGCLAMTDEGIKELFVYCIEANKSGQEKIEITMFPAQLTDSTYNRLTSKYNKDKDKISLWADLKMCYDLFSLTKTTPAVTFLPDGSHEIEGSNTTTNLRIAGTFLKKYKQNQLSRDVLKSMQSQIYLINSANQNEKSNTIRLEDVNVD